MAGKGKSVLMVIAPSKFRDEECLVPKEILERAGAKVTIASKGVHESTGMLGATVSVDKDLAHVNVDEYNAIVFVGGSGSAVYFNDPTALKIAKDAYEKRKVVAAICIAPTILANAGILAGKRATASFSESSTLRAKGVYYTNENVTIDGTIITGKGPAAAQAFGEALAKALGYVELRKVIKKIEQESDLET
jgi:protease I